MSTTTPDAPQAPQLKRTLQGTVISDKRSKSRTVAVSYQVRHPKYGKYLQRQTNYQVHDEENTSKQGDKVEIAACRPMSKTKSYRLVRVITAAPVLVSHQTEPQS